MPISVRKIAACRASLKLAFVIEEQHDDRSPACDRTSAALDVLACENGLDARCQPVGG